MAEKKVVRVSEEELELLKRFREQRSEPSVESVRTSAQSELAEAFVEAIQRTKPPEKKTVATRRRNTPWTPPPGTPQIKMKRKFYHHGLLLLNNVSNEEIDLLNKVRPGNYCGGFVKVTLRRDRGIDIDYPIKTAAQRLRLVNEFGIRNFKELLERIVAEHAAPHKFARPDDLDLFEPLSE